MTEPLFASDDRPQLRRLPIALALVFLALSLAFLRHSHEGWQGGDERFVIEADRWELGALLPWLSWIRVTATGNAPPMETMPEGRDYLPGLHLSPILLGLALAFAAGLAWLSRSVWGRLKAHLECQEAVPTVRLSLAFCVLGLGLSLAPELPNWVPWLLIFVLLPAGTVAACWKRAHLSLAACYLALTLLVMQIVVWVEEGRPLIDRPWDPNRDILPSATAFVLELALAGALLAVLRRSRRRASARKD
jgi:hypothetical protein